MNSVVVILSDKKYLKKAENTINEIRNKGEWKKDIVFISVDFDLEPSFIEKYSLIEKQFPRIDISELQSKLSKKRYNVGDGREINKIIQWEKLHVFDEYFKIWDIVIFFDAGFRIYDKVEFLEDMDCNNVLIAPNDCGYENDRTGKKEKSMYNIIDKETHKDDFESFFQNIRPEDMEKDHFSNCMFMFDTKILDKIHKSEMVKITNQYAIWIANEMSLMNYIFVIKYKMYKELPSRNKNNKYLYAWSEIDLPNTHFNDYCYVKYSNNPDHLMWYI